jgi:hypothetical protein
MCCDIILAQPAYERTSSLRMRRTPDFEMRGCGSCCCCCVRFEDDGEGSVHVVVVVAADSG